MNAPCRRAESFRRISAAEGFHRPRRLVKNTFSPALLWSRVDGVARGVYFCHGTGGNEGCRKASPCSIWARPACIHGRLACATSRWRSIGPADTRSRLCLARKTPRPYSVSPSMPHDHAAGSRRSIRADARASGGPRLCSILFCNRAFSPEGEGSRPQRNFR